MRRILFLARFAFAPVVHIRASSLFIHPLCLKINSCLVVGSRQRGVFPWGADCNGDLVGCGPVGLFFHPVSRVFEKQ